MLSRLRHRDEFHPDLRGLALLLPGQIVFRRTLPLVRRLTGLRGGGSDVPTATTADGVGIRLHRPRTVSGSLPALVWMHGGGYVIGTAAQDDGWAARISERAGVLVISVDYRLAPEHPYPSALDDCLSALRWAVDNPDIDTTRIAIGGASAGGGLAAALAFRARDEGIDLRLQLLRYPMLDDRSRRRDPRHRIWNSAANEFGWSSYLGSADPVVAAPGRHTDLAGLAPAWIGVGSHDLFADEDRHYAERLRTAGVDAHLDEIPGAFHGFDLVAPSADVAREFFELQCAAVRSALHES